MKKTVLLIIMAMILSACGTTSQATPTAIPPTASFTPPPTNTPESTATLTPPPTPKIGTVYLDPEYDLNDRVKIIESNQEALWKYTTESFMMLNSYGSDGKGTGSYIKKLADSVGIDFNDKAALLEFLKNNDIPTEIDGVKFQYVDRFRGYQSYFGVGGLKNIGKLLNLANFTVQIVSGEENNTWVKNNPTIKSHLSSIAIGPTNSLEDDIMVGLVAVDKGDSIEFVYIVLSSQQDIETSFYGIPNPNEAVTKNHTEKLNAYLGGVVYVMRLFVEDDNNPLNKIQNNTARWGLITFPDNGPHVWIAGTDYYFDTVRFNRSQISDFPPDFIEPR